MNVPRFPAVSRRAALMAAVGAVAVGTSCTTDRADPDAEKRSPERAAEPLPDVTLAATVVADEQELLDLIDATLARHPRLERVLADARAAHAAHVMLLEDAAPESAVPSPSPTAPGRVRVPDDPARAVHAIARREDRLALVDKTSAFAAESGAFARVLASMAASAAQQAVLLRAAPVAVGGSR